MSAIAAGLVGSQPSTPTRPEFEVISIKPPTPGSPGSRPQINCSAGRLISSGVELKIVIEWAYDIRTEFKVPEWAGSPSEAYTIEAKAAGPITMEQCRLMTQSLLEDRFRLELHREAKEMPIYALVVGKGGSKLREVKTDAPLGDGVWLQRRKASSKGWEPWMLASTLTGVAGIGRPVVDRTGMKGLFEFRLEYSVRPNDDRPDIFTAVQEQLGLKLESGKGLVEIVILDRLEKPSAN